MANFLSLYEQKKSTFSEALSLIQNKDKIVLPLGCGEPVGLVGFLSDNLHQFDGITVHQMLPLRSWRYFEDEYNNNVKHYSWFISGISRKAVNSGHAESVPNYFFESPRLICEYLNPNVVMAAVSPMDKHGFFSLGVSVDYTWEAIKNADRVILEVNKYMPRTMGNSFVHISEVDCLVENHVPLIEIPQAEVGPAEEKIGQQIAELVEDGSTLQLGIGAIPNAITKYLTDKKDLGIHSEMLTDGMVDLVNKGVITNAKKTIHRGKIIGTFAAGTRKLYDFLDDNPVVEMYPVSYTNDPAIISKNYKMVAINAALQIDLTGQVAAESLGHYQFSGTGGQVDFLRGANAANGGKPIIALNSVAQGGNVSRIVSTLPSGAVVTTPRTEVGYVVTEFGVCNLKGKSLRERARSLINIAHPDFRESLTQEAKKLNLI